MRCSRGRGTSAADVVWLQARFVEQAQRQTPTVGERVVVLGHVVTAKRPAPPPRTAAVSYGQDVDGLGTQVVLSVPGRDHHRAGAVGFEATVEKSERICNPDHRRPSQFRDAERNLHQRRVVQIVRERREAVDVGCRQPGVVERRQNRFGGDLELAAVRDAAPAGVFALADTDNAGAARAAGRVLIVAADMPRPGALN